jgi:hypothetical protein
MIFYYERLYKARVIGKPIPIEALEF